MNRNEKADSVKSLNEKFAKANAAFLTEYRGMTVQQLYELRTKVRLGQGEVRVVKNRLAKIAVKGTAFEGITDSLKGPIAVAFSYKDAVAVAKAVDESIIDTSPLKVKTASLQGKLINAAGIKALSKLPSKDVLLSMMLSALQAPTRNFASVLAAIPRDFVNVLSAVKTDKEKKA
jgi:large subunit ribosomal protein L10